MLTPAEPRDGLDLLNNLESEVGSYLTQMLKRVEVLDGELREA